jgi:hypothetical protein
MQSKVFKHALAALLAFGMSAAAAEELVALGPTPLTNCYTAKELYGTDVGARIIYGPSTVLAALSLGCTDAALL